MSVPRCASRIACTSTVSPGAIGPDTAGTMTMRCTACSGATGAVPGEGGGSGGGGGGKRDAAGEGVPLEAGGAPGPEAVEVEVVVPPVVSVDAVAVEVAVVSVWVPVVEAAPELVDGAVLRVDAGARVAVSSRKEPACLAVVAEIEGRGGEAMAAAGNAGRAEDAARIVAAVMERWGRLDVLVNNAATNPEFGPLLSHSESAVDKTFEVNLKGPLNFTREAVRRSE